jgi:hypothetical protein
MLNPSYPAIKLARLNQSTHPAPPSLEAAAGCVSFTSSNHYVDSTSPVQILVHSPPEPISVHLAIIASSPSHRRCHPFHLLQSAFLHRRHRPQSFLPSRTAPSAIPSLLSRESLPCPPRTRDLLCPRATFQPRRHQFGISPSSTTPSASLPLPNHGVIPLPKSTASQTPDDPQLPVLIPASPLPSQRRRLRLTSQARRDHHLPVTISLWVSVQRRMNWERSAAICTGMKKIKWVHKSTQQEKVRGSLVKIPWVF